jgi:DNA polymerase-4/protein ImuB
VAARTAPPGGTRIVPAGETAAFLAPLPVMYLTALPPEALQRLELLGLRTLGQLAELPFAAVQAELGAAGARAWRLASGRDDAPVVSRPLRPSVQAALRFDDPLASVEAVMAALDQLLAGAFGQGEALRGRSVRQVRLRALLTDGSSWERLYTFKEALASREAARFALKSKLELPNGLPPAPLDELSLELLGLAGEAAKQASLFSARASQRGQVAEAARQLRARYGRMPLYHAVEVEPWSRLPERRWALVTCDF